MKRIILIFGILFLTSYNFNTNATTIERDTETKSDLMVNSSIKTDCFAAISKEKLDEVTRASVKKDSDAILALIAKGYVVILKKGTEVNVVRTGLSVKKIQVISGSYSGKYFYIASEFAR